MPYVRQSAQAVFFEGPFCRSCEPPTTAPTSATACATRPSGCSPSTAPDAVTIRQLAQAIGVSPMTPYGYFKDKDAILAAVRARAFDRHADALEKAFAAAPPTPPRDRRRWARPMSASRFSIPKPTS